MTNKYKVTFVKTIVEEYEIDINDIEGFEDEEDLYEMESEKDINEKCKLVNSYLDEESVPNVEEI